MGFQRMLGMVRSEYLPGGPHGCEGAAISVSALCAFRAAVARRTAPVDLILPSSLFGVVLGSLGGV